MITIRQGLKGLEERIKELKGLKELKGFSPLFAALLKEGYQPEEVIFYLGEYLAFS